MKPNNAIEVTDVTKSFKVYFDKGNTMKEKVLFQKRRRYEERRVLDGICFEVKKGEAIGLIGHNGCGKSTTLKLLTKIMYPDKGKIEMRGRVSSLIELGAGFHPDMSGRENISMLPYLDFRAKRLMPDWTILSNFPSWKSILIILCGRILPECICVWRFLLPLMSMQTFC